MSISDKLAQLHALPAEKQSFIGTALGALGGAVTGEKGYRGRAIGRGAAKGLGADVGMAVGTPIGAGVGALAGGIATLPIGGFGAIPGAALGGLTGAYQGGRLGYNAANSMLGPYKSKREEMLDILNEWAQNGGSQSAYPMSANARVAPQPLPENVAKALHAHLNLPKNIQPDELDAAETLLNLESEKMSTQKKAAWPKAIENANSWLQRTLNSGGNPLNVNYHNMAAIGAGIGGLGGAVTAPKGKMLKRTLQGAGIGALGGLGAGIGGQLGSNIAHSANGHAGGRSLLTGLGAFGGGMLGRTLADKALNEITDDTDSADRKRQEQQEKDEEEMRSGLSKISRQQKASALNDYVTSPMAHGALMGGAGSALAGGLAGLVAPGYEDTVDEYGNPVRKQRNRFGAAMRGALGAGALGAAGGAAAGHFAPNMVSQGMNHLQNFGQNMAFKLRGGKVLPSGSADDLMNDPAGAAAPMPGGMIG